MCTHQSHLLICDGINDTQMYIGISLQPLHIALAKTYRGYNFADGGGGIFSTRHKARLAIQFHLSVRHEQWVLILEKYHVLVLLAVSRTTVLGIGKKLK